MSEELPKAKVEKTIPEDRSEPCTNCGHEYDSHILNDHGRPKCTRRVSAFGPPELAICTCKKPNLTWKLVKVPYGSATLGCTMKVFPRSNDNEGPGSSINRASDHRESAEREIQG